MRNIINWNKDWEFCKGEQEETNWEKIVLPHTWNAYDGQDGENDYYQGIAWYRKSFRVDAAWKQIYVRFGAVNKMAEIWCNGTYIGVHKGGFSAFTFELTPYLKSGENEILVKADNSNDLPIYPRQADFTFFGGIYRDVELIWFNEETHFDLMTYGTDAVFVTPRTNGMVEVTAFADKWMKVCALIFDADGACVAEAERMIDECDDAATKKIGMKLRVENVHRWNGKTDAYLYLLKLRLVDENGILLDEISSYFGFRDFYVDAKKGFYLNGMPYPLHGVCRHQDRENMGWAITAKEHLEDMALIREVGANTIRLAHYQQAPYFYELCDRNGMVVWAEIPFISVYDDRAEADENLRQQMKELVLQNYNHPSICFWGIANEVGIGGESEKMYDILRELHSMTKKMDADRLTTIANVGMTKTSSPLFHITDLTSYNEYMGWYEGTKEDHGEFCDRHHEEIPDIPLAISEYGAESILSWHSEKPVVKDYTEEYQALVHEAAMEAFGKRSYLWATWLWNMFDFAADARDEGGCKGRNNKGLVTYDRRTKKQAFYYYKACWSKEPFVYLCGKRFLKHAEEKITVKVYSNQRQVSLWVNGTLIGKNEGQTVFVFHDVELWKPFNEILVRTEDGCMDSVIFEKVDELPEAYTLKEEKNLSDAVVQWFANLQDTEQNEVAHELIVREGYLSVYDPLEEVYRYQEGFAAVQELVAKPLSMSNPAMASRMQTGGAMSFSGIWNHIHKLLPDEVIYLLNERLNKIKKL